MIKNRYTFSLALLFFFSSTSFSQTTLPIRVAFNDLPGIDMLNVLIAFEKAKERGLDIQVSYLQSEGIAAQAVVDGQADIGMGTPYRLVQQSGAPIRMFFQLNKLRFHPIVNANYLKSWKDLDGIVMYTHGPGSGTEAIMNMLAKQNGISYRAMKYVPGSGVRARAMLKRRIKATIVDTERRNLLLNSRRGNFKLLPMPEIHASDEALYANKAFIDKRMDDLKILVEELLQVWRNTNNDPDYIAEMSNHYELLPRLSAKKLTQIPVYFSEMVEVGAFPNDGGLKSAFASDVDFYTFAGTLTGEAKQLNEEEFWDFRPLKKVLNQD